MCCVCVRKVMVLLFVHFIRHFLLESKVDTGEIAKLFGALDIFEFFGGTFWDIRTDIERFWSLLGSFFDKCHLCHMDAAVCLSVWKKYVNSSSRYVLHFFSRLVLFSSPDGGVPVGGMAVVSVINHRLLVNTGSRKGDKLIVGSWIMLLQKKVEILWLAAMETEEKGEPNESVSWGASKEMYVTRWRCRYLC